MIRAVLVGVLAGGMLAGCSSPPPTPEHLSDRQFAAHIAGEFPSVHVKGAAVAAHDLCKSLASGGSWASFRARVATVTPVYRPVLTRIGVEGVHNWCPKYDQ